MQLQRFGAKFFLEDPPKLRLTDLIEVFHSWIQNQQIADHLLIDVHNYSHVHWGPGVLLVAHEGNFSLDLDQGRPGLFYCRKQPIDAKPQERLTRVLRTALEACHFLETGSTPNPGIRFQTREFLVVANDRLNSPATAEAHQALSELVAKMLNERMAPHPVKVVEKRRDPRERLTVVVRTDGAIGTKELLQLLAGPSRKTA